MKASQNAPSQVVEAAKILRTVSEEAIRNRDYGEAPYLIPGLLYFGATVIYADGGLGKTVLAHALEHHLAFGRPFGGWVTDDRHRCLVVSLEDDERQVNERSFRITPADGLTTDGHPEVTEADGFNGAIEHAFYVAGDTFASRVDNLRLYLHSEAEAGRAFSYVRIDTYGDFVGGKPRDTNAYEWDKHCTTRLNKLALELNMAIVLIHHTNKKGEFSGSEGLRGGVTTLAVLERSEEQPEREAVLRSHKCRVAAEFAYALSKGDDGVWEFTEEIRPSEIELRGMSRAACAALSRLGPMTRQELGKHLTDVNHNSLQVCLSRLKRRGFLTFGQGQWSMAQQRMEEGRLPRRCRREACDLPLLEDLYGDGYHATCAPLPAGIPSPAPPPPAETIPKPEQLTLGGDAPKPPILCMPPGVQPTVRDLEIVQEFRDALAERAEADAEFFDDAASRAASRGAYKAMRASLEGSRMKPADNVRKEHRAAAPWTLMSERMDASHKWLAPDLPEEGWVTVLDRTGSFPSACSSVPVAPNALRYLDEEAAADRKGLAGIWRIRLEEWTESGIGHPLGRLALEDGPLWVTSASLDHLEKLARAGRLDAPVVLEGWAGRRNSSLFERFSEWSRKIYAMPDSEERTAGKRGASQAIRAFWPKSAQARSPWFRPDWNVSIRAEASVRHWIRADQAVQAGATLLALRSTDEAHIWTPDKPTDGWVPAPYVLGTKFGEVKIKGDAAMPVAEWKETLGGKRKR